MRELFDALSVPILVLLMMAWTYALTRYYYHRAMVKTYGLMTRMYVTLRLKDQLARWPSESEIENGVAQVDREIGLRERGNGEMRMPWSRKRKRG